MYSYEHLFAYTGDSKWAERLEVLAFNALPATVSEDMWAHQYDQMSNQIACKKLFPFSHFGTNGPRAHLFGLEPNFGCCTANFSQGFPKLVISSFMHKDNTIINSLMLPCRLNTKDVKIEIKTNYPFENKVEYIINSKKAFDFIIRIPSFAERLTLNGIKLETKDIEININEGETKINIEFETPVILKARPNNLYTVKKGSLLFSLPISYKKKMLEYTKRSVERKYPYCDWEYLPTSDWSYAFSGKNFKVKYNGISDIPFSQENAPINISAKMQKINWGHMKRLKTVCAKTPESVKPISKAETIELIPYGCAKLRMTEMPIIEE